MLLEYKLPEFTSYETRDFYISQRIAMNGYSQYNNEYKSTKDNKKKLNSLFDNEFDENNVSLILKKIYDTWLVSKNDFNLPITNVVGRKIKIILRENDGGGPVQFDFYK
jgi:hypothetical protein